MLGWVSTREPSDRLDFHYLSERLARVIELCSPIRGLRKTLTREGIEPATFGLDHRCSPTEQQDQTGVGRGY